MKLSQVCRFIGPARDGGVLEFGLRGQVRDGHVTEFCHAVVEKNCLALWRNQNRCISLADIYYEMNLELSVGLPKSGGCDH